MVAPPLLTVLSHRFCEAHVRTPSPRSRSRRRGGETRPTTPRLRPRSLHRLHAQQSPRRVREQTAENAVAAHHVRCQGVVEASLSTRSLATSRRRSTRNVTTTSSTVIRRTTSTAMPPSACRWSRRRSRRPPPPPQVSRSTRVGTVSARVLARPRRRRTRKGTTTPSADDTQTSSPATHRTARGRPRTPTWSSRSRPGPPWRARPFPLRVIACISEHVLTQQRTRTISRPSSCNVANPSSSKSQRRCAAPVSLRTRGTRTGSEGRVSAK